MGDTKMTATDARILAARASLTDRIAALEDRVTATVDSATGTVDHATASIRGTVEDATKSVRNLLENTSDNYRGVLDIRQQVRDNPWQGLLLAVGAGLVTRLLVTQKPLGESLNRETQPHSFTANPLADIVGILKRELVGLGETAVATVSQKLRDNIASLTTPSVAERVQSVTAEQHVRSSPDLVHNGRY